MKGQEASKEKITLSLSRDELLILHQALNEVLNGLEVPELSTRMGGEQADIAALMRHLKSAVEARSAA